MPAPQSAQVGDAQRTAPERLTVASQPQPTAETSSALPANSTAGPTDERGSPLFVPTAPAEQPPSQPDIQSPTPTRTQRPDNIASTSPSTTPASVPWTTDSWGFGAEPTNEASQPARTSDPETSTEQQSQAEESESNEVYAGKGKGRAVEVEDAPDQDA